MNTYPIAGGSNISAIGYDPQARQLQVDFQNGGSYLYDGISPDQYANFAGSPSKGKHLQSIIKGSASGVRKL